MITVFVSALAFVAAYATWRWGLKGKNWSEGVSFALVVVLPAAAVTSAAVARVG